MTQARMSHAQTAGAQEREPVVVPPNRSVAYRFGAINVALALIGVAFLLPLLWLVFASFDSKATASLAWPHFSLDNFRNAVDGGVSRAILNSLYLAVVSTVITTTVATAAGYALSRRRIPFKGLMLLGVLFLSSLPSTMLLIPIYQMYVDLGWLDSPFYTSLVLAASSVPFAVWLLKNFIDQVPRELGEAAAIEGAAEWRILLWVVVPLATPGIMVAAMLTFISSWGAFVIPLVLDTNPDNLPGAVGVYQFMSANAQVQFGPLAAYGLLFSLPVVVLYLIASRWLNGGFAFAGSVKG